MATALREISPARIFARPTAEDLWLGPARASVLSQLSEPVATRALVGPRSSGRSTLLRHLAYRNAKIGPTLRLAHPAETPEDVLRGLVESAGLAAPPHHAVSLRHRLDVYLAGQRGLGSRVHLEIDNADRLGANAWKEIERVVGTGGNSPGPLLLLGLTALDGNGAPAAAYVRAQGAPVIGRLSWLNADEVADYLHWRFSRAGLPGCNTPAATRLLARCSRGCFAAIDHLCQVALLLLRQSGGAQLDITLVREAAEQVQMRRRAGAQRQPRSDQARGNTQIDASNRRNAATR